MEETYKEFLDSEGFDEFKVMNDYFNYMKEYDEKCNKNNEEIIEKIKQLVSESYLNAINEFITDKEHGIYGEFELVSEPIGEWQSELTEWTELEYWSELKGMYVNQSCGYSGDDYSGTLEINITNGLYLRCLFSL